MDQLTADTRGSLAKSAFAGKCPRCGQGKLYSGFLTVADKCDCCGLDYSFSDSGDGPAVFVIMIVGFLATGGVLYTEFAFEPSLWMLVALWAPATILLCLLFLYWFKGALIAQQFFTKAKQGRQVEPENGLSDSGLHHQAHDLGDNMDPAKQGSQE